MGLAMRFLEWMLIASTAQLALKLLYLSMGGHL